MKQNIVDVMDFWLQSKLDNIHTIIPGEIVKYEGHKERKAEVKPLIRPKTARNKTITIQPISNVPVIFPSSGKFNMLFPLEKGDGVMLLFSEAAIGEYLAGSGVQDADNNVRFSLTDCIAIPGLWSFKNVPQAPANDTDFFLEYENAKIQIEQSTNNVNIESIGSLNLLGATESFIKGDTWKSAFQTYLTTVSSQTGGNEAANAAAINAISSAATALLAQLTNMLSTKIKGE